MEALYPLTINNKYIGNTSLAIGATGFLDEDKSQYGFGPRLRVIKYINKIDSQFGPWISYNSYSGRGKQFERTNVGVNFEKSLGLCFFNVGLGYKHTINEDSELDGSFAVSTSLSFYSPPRGLLKEIGKFFRGK